VLDLRDAITFEGKSVKEIERAFRESIDDCLESCKERHGEPDSIVQQSLRRTFFRKSQRLP
jgi:predicted HicB family RNase H-like nuclease